MSSVAATLAKFSMDVCLYMSRFHFTSASNHWFQHYATQEKPDVLN
jgi:hypothetical protein